MPSDLVLFGFAECIQALASGAVSQLFVGAQTLSQLKLDDAQRASFPVSVAQDGNDVDFVKAACVVCVCLCVFV